MKAGATTFRLLTPPSLHGASGNPTLQLAPSKREADAPGLTAVVQGSSGRFVACGRSGIPLRACLGPFNRSHTGTSSRSVAFDWVPAGGHWVRRRPVGAVSSSPRVARPPVPGRGYRNLGAAGRTIHFDA